MATIREKKPGVWEVRALTGNDVRGRPKQISRTVRGGKRNAQRVAASLAVGPGSASPVGRNVTEVLTRGSTRTSTRGRPLRLDCCVFDLGRTALAVQAQPSCWSEWASFQIFVMCWIRSPSNSIA